MGNRSIDSKLFSVGGLILVLAIAVLANVVLANVNLRWDLTEDKVYSLSDGTAKILDSLEDPVTLHLFFSKSNPAMPVHIETYARRVLDFLSEYRHLSGGMVDVVVHDPKPDSEEEDWAVKYGVQGLDLPSGDRVYLGLAAVSLDREQTIPFLDPDRENRLEYDVTRTIAQVRSSGRKRIAVISGLPVFGGRQMTMQGMGGMMPTWLFVTELRKAYDVVQVSPDQTELPENTDLVMLIAPQEVPDALLYAVDRHIASGKNAIIFADPMPVTAGRPPMSMDSPLSRLFSAWGVTVDFRDAVIDMDHATRLRSRDGQVENNPMWISASSDTFNTDDMITSRLEGMLLPVAGEVKQSGVGTLEFTPLMQTGVNAMVADAMKARYGTAEIRRTFKADGERHVLAARIRGVFPTAFPDGKPKSTEADKEGEDLQPPEPAAETPLEPKPATVVIVADADFLYDAYYVDRQNFLGVDLHMVFNDNLNFLQNACELLTGDDALIGIRSRGKFERPFTRVQALQRKAEAKWLAREQELAGLLENANRRLQELESKKDASQQLVLSPEQEAEIERFHEERTRISRELKEVRRNLRADIEALGRKVKFINLFFMPILVCVVGVAFAAYNRGRRRRDSE